MFSFLIVSRSFGLIDSEAVWPISELNRRAVTVEGDSFPVANYKSFVNPIVHSRGEWWAALSAA